jgi:hypothetical protein
MHKRNETVKIGLVVHPLWTFFFVAVVRSGDPR